MNKKARREGKMGENMCAIKKKIEKRGKRRGEREKNAKYGAQLEHTNQWQGS